IYSHLWERSSDVARWEAPIRILEKVQGQANLLQIVATLCSVSRRAHLLHSRQQKSNQNGNNGDHDQQLYQCECAPPGGLLTPGSDAGERRQVTSRYWAHLRHPVLSCGESHGLRRKASTEHVSCSPKSRLP